MANVGVGSLDFSSESATDNFYEKAGKLAKEKGIIISVITIKGSECKVSELGKLADLTGGRVTRVNPEKVGKNFKKALEDQLVGIDVEIRVRLHDALRFRDEMPQYLLEDESVFLKELGNVTNTTELTFEYEPKAW